MVSKALRVSFGMPPQDRDPLAEGLESLYKHRVECEQVFLDVDV